MATEFVTGLLVSALLEEFIDKIKTCTYNQIHHFFSNVEAKLKTLKGSYAQVQVLTDRVDEWDLVTSKPHRDWIGDVTRACYDIEDFMADVVVDFRKSGYNLSYLKNWSLSRQINELQSSLDDVSGMAAAFVVPTDRERKNPLKSGLPAREPVIVPADVETFWRKKEKEAIVEKLLHLRSSTSSTGSNSIIVIIQGMFGVGKSMLAQVVKNDSRVKQNFDLKIWVPMSGEFNMAKAVTLMIQGLGLEQVSEQQFATIFQRHCAGSRVLIVLDDCDFSRTRDWEEFHSILVGPSSTFGILITTRSPKVARTVSSLSTIPVVSQYLHLMSDEDCQSLMVSRALMRRSNCPSKRKRCTLEETALKLAEKFCKGLPLVANVIGVHLSSEPEGRWSNLLSKNLWDMPEFAEQIFPAFRLIYSGLPKALKNCFCYLSLFPDNFRFEKQEMVQLWMAEGFVVPGVVREPHLLSLEEIGNDYFDEFLSRSILEIHNPFDQEPQVYRTHEFLRCYAQYVSSDVYLRLDDKFVDSHSLSNKNRLQLTDTTATWYRKSRHISFLCRNVKPSILEDIEKCKALRTLISVLERTHIEPPSYSLFLNLHCLRVLSLSGTDISKLPESIGKLKHLSLLDVSGTDIEDLPASTDHLHELRVLKLKDCGKLLRLPNGTKHLTNLLHLEVDGTSLSSMPPKIGKLRNLRTLPVFIAGDEDGCLITELKKMQHLQGSICLKNLENVTCYAEAEEAELRNKPLLKKLELEWNNSWIDHSVTEEVLDGLEPHEDLEEIRVSGYNGKCFPSWLSSPNCGLKIIHLQGCHRCSILPPLGQLQHLKDLHIHGMESVKLTDHRFSSGGSNVGFPSLVSLKIQDMANLEKWQGLQAIHMPTLHDLFIIDCPNLVSLPSLNLLTSLKTLEICDCPMLQSLPEEGLPFSLQSLIIIGSDLVQQRCQPEQGADWEKIKIVPEVVIDFVQVRTMTTI